MEAVLRDRKFWGGEMKKLAVCILFLVNSAFAAELILIEMKTSKGTIELELYPEKAPKTVANFLKYADAGFYNGTIFHRVVYGFVIQGGGFNRDMEKKKTARPITIESDNGLTNLAGTISMARKNSPNSATSQFFFNMNNNKHLDYKGKFLGGYGYSVFGRIRSGIAVLNRIEASEVGEENGRRYVPVEDIYIKSVKRKK